MTRRYYVVLGDVVESRGRADRAALRGTIETALAGANDRYAQDLVAEFALVKGVDEVAGVLARPDNCYRLFRDVVAALRPGGIRFAVVYDEIDVGVPGDDVAAMDGPAFHRADDALREVARTGLYVAFQGQRRALDGLVSAGVNLLLMAREGWTERQRAVVAAYEDADTQAQVAERLDVSQQTVSATLRRADWPRLSRLEAQVNEGLAGYEPGGGDDDGG